MTTSMTRYAIGDLIVIDHKKKFPVSLRAGPGYTHAIVTNIEPGNAAVVIEFEQSSGVAATWVRILVNISGKNGWISESALNRLTTSEKII